MSRLPKKIKHLDPPFDSGNYRWLCTLAPGWAFVPNRGDSSEHIKGFDTKRAALQAMRGTVFPCACTRCLTKNI